MDWGLKLNRSEMISGHIMDQWGNINRINKGGIKPGQTGRNQGLTWDKPEIILDRTVNRLTQDSRFMSRRSFLMRTSLCLWQQLFATEAELSAPPPLHITVPLWEGGKRGGGLDLGLRSCPTSPSPSSSGGLGGFRWESLSWSSIRDSVQIKNTRIQTSVLWKSSADWRHQTSVSKDQMFAHFHVNSWLFLSVRIRHSSKSRKQLKNTEK